MAENTSTTPTKRLLVDKTNSTIVAVTAVAAFVIIFSLVASKTLFSQAMYQNRVVSAKRTTLTQLKGDITASKALVTSYTAFDSPLQNIIGGTATGSGPNDGPNSRIILDALPSSYDFPALVTSLEKIITSRGLAIQSIQGTDDEVAQQSNQTSATPQPVPIPFQVAITGKYADLQNLIADFENSIRPFQIQTESFSGDENSMTLTITAQTYYQPGKVLSIGSKVIK